MCAHPGCNSITSIGFCAEHSKQATKGYYRRNRDRSTSTPYDTTWTWIRKIHLSEHPFCETCKAEGRAMRATLVHHIDGNPRNNKESNHISLCRWCHIKAHNKMKRALSNANE